MKRIVAWMICIIAVVGEVAQAGEGKVDLVEFYKRAISSPPDVEYFLAGLRPLGELPKVSGRTVSREMTYLQGARSQSNFFGGFAIISNPLVEPKQSRHVAGRVGTLGYSFSDNSVSYYTGTNRSKYSVEIGFDMVCQFLEMGLVNINPRSVVWNGNAFVASRFDGSPRHGFLLISNDLPNVLTITEGKNSSPIARIRYEYPDLPERNSGFPEKMVVEEVFKDGSLKPVVEKVLKEVRLAAVPLKVEFFNPAQFMHTSIVVTNYYENGVHRVTDRRHRKGELFLDPEKGLGARLPKADKAEKGNANSSVR